MLKRLVAIVIVLAACLIACLAPPARAEDAAAPFDGELQRLAEILGTLHYLRGICGSAVPRSFKTGATRTSSIYRRVSLPLAIFPTTR